MRRIETEDLKRIQLEILDVVAEFCNKNGINYWIDCGTLLGAIRHKGYIPWDDDIDVGMLREDYDRFVNLFNAYNSRYQFVCIENSPDFYLPYGKVCDMSTVLFEPDEQGYKLAVNVDIFVYDNAPDDNKIVKKMFDKRDKLSYRFGIVNSNAKPTGNFIFRVAKYGRRYLYRMLFGRKLIEKMVDNSKLYAKEPLERVGDFVAFGRRVCHKRVFASFVDVEFEGKLYKAPIGYDEWLTVFYGDYMELPPVEQRVTHHSFVAYIKG